MVAIGYRYNLISCFCFFGVRFSFVRSQLRRKNHSPYGDSQPLIIFLWTSFSLHPQFTHAILIPCFFFVFRFFWSVLSWTDSTLIAFCWIFLGHLRKMRPITILGFSASRIDPKTSHAPHLPHSLLNMISQMLRGIFLTMLTFYDNSWQVSWMIMTALVILLLTSFIFILWYHQ